MKRWTLTTRVYVALVVLTVLTIAVAVWRWDDPWARNWLPNFVAEWSGLFIAVAIVDRLLSRARAEREAARREPLRSLAGTQLRRALEGIITTAVHEYASRDQSQEEPPEPAADFFERWSPTIADNAYVRDAGWVYILANAFESSVQDLTRFRAQYESALEPEELAHLDALTERLREDERDLGTWGEDIDSDFKREGFRAQIPPLTRDEVASNVQNRCVHLSPYFAAVAADYRTLTGAELTTDAGWNSVRLTRATWGLVMERPDEPSV